MRRQSRAEPWLRAVTASFSRAQLGQGLVLPVLRWCGGLALSDGNAGATFRAVTARCCGASALWCPARAAFRVARCSHGEVLLGQVRRGRWIVPFGTGTVGKRIVPWRIGWAGQGVARLEFRLGCRAVTYWHCGDP